ncbi:hypothetical protein, partial [Ruminococcus sp.]|uniref:hypothetical protein n=1 Tax=Ruminococcus sp. TaxID=41978 RepID=UPI0025EBC9E1
KQGNEFIFKNKFTPKKISKNDRNLTLYLKLKYKIIKTFHLFKREKNSSWFLTLDDLWSRRNRVPNDYEKSRLSKCIRLTQKDLQLKKLIIYDLFPKEYLSEYKRKYLKFKDRYETSYIHNRDKLRVLSSFSQMESSCSAGTIFYLDFFNIKENTPLGAAFDRLAVEFIGLTDSFYTIRYILEINESANKLLDRILKSKIYKEAICISKDKWWRKDSFAGCHPYNIGESAKADTIEDFVLELKAIFWKELSTHLFTHFFSWDNIPPSVEIYSSKTLDEKSTDILTILSCKNPCLEYNKTSKIFFSPFSSNWSFNKPLNNSIIVADSSQFEDDEHGLYPFLEIDDVLRHYCTDYFILNSVNRIATELIYKAQRRIDKSIYKKGKYRTLLNIKLEVDKQLYFYRRLYKELCSSPNLDDKVNYNISQYNNVFLNQFNDNNPKYKTGFAFPAVVKSLYYDINNNYKLMESIYSHFEDNLKIIESRYNYRIVKWTLIVALLTLLATIALSGNPSIYNFINSFLPNN